jgi:arylsulfatase A
MTNFLNAPHQAVGFINKWAGNPYFLYMTHTSPHIPLYCSPAFCGKSGEGIYGDVIQEIDWSVGQVMEALQTNGVDQNTLVMFTSDHGPWFQGSPGGQRGRKGDTFDGGVRTPFIARFPGRNCRPHAQAPPQIRKYPHARNHGHGTGYPSYDRRFTQIPQPPNPSDGVDIGPLLTGQAADISRPLFLYFSTWDLQCARMGPWKLHVARNTVPAYTATPQVGFFNLRLINPEPYNIDTDPEESVDVSTQNPGIVAQIQQQIQQALPSFPADVQTAWAKTQSIPVYPNEPGSYPTPMLS